MAPAGGSPRAESCLSYDRLWRKERAIPAIDEAEAGQATEGIPDRGIPHPVLRGHLLDPEVLATLQLAANDPILQILGGGFRNLREFLDHNRALKIKLDVSWSFFISYALHSRQEDSLNLSIRLLGYPGARRTTDRCDQRVYPWSKRRFFHAHSGGRPLAFTSPAGFTSARRLCAFQTAGMPATAAPFFASRCSEARRRTHRTWQIDIMTPRVTWRSRGVIWHITGFYRFLRGT